MKKQIAYIILMIAFLGGYSQRTIVSQNVEKDTQEKTYGKNLKNYFHFYMGYGSLVLQSESGSEVILPSSGEFEFGLRYEKSLNRHFNLGFNVAYRNRGFKLAQVDSKTFPNSTMHDYEKLKFYEADFSVYERINFGKIGNDIGKFWDLGAYADVPVLVTHTTTNTMDNGNKVITQLRGLNYINSYNYGVETRFGIKRYVLWGRYRLSDQFTADSGYAEMGRLSVGLQIGFH